MIPLVDAIVYRISYAMAAIHTLSREQRTCSDQGQLRSEALVEERREEYTEQALIFMSNCSTGGLFCVGAT
jgi:hypothetical protein